ncbi:MAG: ABC transporter permease [Ignisphaera sp.]
MQEIFSDLRVIVLLIQWDLMKIMRRVIFVAMRAVWFAVQVAVFGQVLAQMVNARGIGLDASTYYNFYIFGIYTSILFTITASRAYDIAEEFEEGIIEYQLSLPMKRKVLAFGRAIGSGIASTFFTLPMFLTVLLLAKEVDLLATAISLISALVFSIAISGLVLSITLSIKSSDATDILMGVLDAVLVRLSTVFYPAVVLKNIAPYYYAALVNPLSHVADILRILYSFEDFKAIAISHPLAMVSYILGLFVGFTFLAMYVIEKKIEGGGWR